MSRRFSAGTCCAALVLLAAGPAAAQEPRQASGGLGFDRDAAWSAVEPALSPVPREAAGRPAAGAADGDGAAHLLRRPAAERPGKGGVLSRGQLAKQRSGSSWVRTTGALAGVVGLILLLGWGYRAVVAGRVSLAGRGKRPGLIEIISRTTLSPKHSLHLVRVGQRMVLVGMSSDRLVALDVLADADATSRLAGQAAAQRDASQTRGFARLLESEALRYDGRPPGTPETLGPEERRLFDLKQQLRGAIRRVRSAVGGA